MVGADPKIEEDIVAPEKIISVAEYEGGNSKLKVPSDFEAIRHKPKKESTTKHVLIEKAQVMPVRLKSIMVD